MPKDPPSVDPPLLLALLPLPELEPLDSELPPDEDDALETPPDDDELPDDAPPGGRRAAR